MIEEFGEFNFKPFLEKEKHLSQPQVTYKEGAIRILKDGIPSFFSMVVIHIQEVINISFIGHMGIESLISGIAMGNVFINIVVFAPCYGINGAADTLLSQSFGNNQNYLAGAILNWGRIVSAVLFIPLAIFLWFIEPFMIKIGMDTESSQYASVYIWRLLPGLFFAL